MRQRTYHEHVHTLTTHYDQEEDGHGTAAAQVALLSARIDALAQHLHTHHRDYNSRRGLLRLVSRRNRILASLAKADPSGYAALAAHLNLRMAPPAEGEDVPQASQ